MKKHRTDTPMFVCTGCGFESLKWLGKCPGCGEWNTFTEFRRPGVKSGAPGRAVTRFTGEVQRISDLPATEQARRIITGMGEFDRIMGGGIVPGSVVLLGGEPGIGKSTLMLQIADLVARTTTPAGTPCTVLYVSGEESVHQIKLRADRLDVRCGRLLVVSETSIERVAGMVETVAPDVMVLDSIQTLYSENIPASQGSIAQIRGVTAEIITFAKTRNIMVFILGHVTKDGDIAGPKLLEHMVDTVLYFESETVQNYRILRVNKNRFGPTSEIGVFEMTGAGLREVPNPSAVFVEYHKNLVGTVTTCVMEGSRPLLTQVQALVAHTYFPQPRRVVTGLDYNRATLLISVLEKYTGAALSSEDVYLSVVSGLKTRETAPDLAVTLAVYTAHRGIAVDHTSLYFGEIGLTGELRAVGFVAERIAEAVKLGYHRVYLPRANEKHAAQAGVAGCETVFVDSIKDIDKLAQA